jgi:type IV pilus assembly protein PilW
MRARPSAAQRGVGIIEIMVGILISMLMVLIIYQVYLVSEGQKRTITAGSDAQQNASYGPLPDRSGSDGSGAGDLVVDDGARGLLDAAPDTGRDLGRRDRRRSGFDHGLLRRIGLVVDTGAALERRFRRLVAARSLRRRGAACLQSQRRRRRGQGTNCTLSTIDAGGRLRRGADRHRDNQSHAHGDDRQQHDRHVRAVAASLVNLGQAATAGEAARFGQTVYTVDAGSHTLRTQSLLPTVQAVTPVVSGVINLKAQFGLDTDNDGTVDTWQPATGNWSAANLPLQPLATWQQIRAFASPSSRAATSTSGTSSRPGRSGCSARQTRAACR